MSCATAAMRAQVPASRRCWATGAWCRTWPGCAKDNTGYDLAGLLTGSEGTLGMVITAARLRLVPSPRAPRDRGSGPGRRGRGGGARCPGCGRLAGLEAVELMLRGGSQLVADQLGLQPPSGAPGCRRRSSWRSVATTTPWRSWPGGVAELDLVREPRCVDRRISGDGSGRYGRESFADAHIKRRGPARARLDVAARPAWRRSCLVARRRWPRRGSASGSSCSATWATGTSTSTWSGRPPMTTGADGRGAAISCCASEAA